MARKLTLWIVGGFFAVIIVFVGIFYAIVQLSPFDPSKLTQTSQPTVVYDTNGKVYLTIASNGASDLTYNQIPTNLQNALIATEDHNYWHENGVDVRSVFRSLFVDLLAGHYAQGGSTIPEQLAKIVFLNSKKTITRKLEQVVLGMQINRYYSKQDILAMYLNQVYLGENTVGAEQAAQRYFGIDLATDPKALTLDQAALLAGLPQAPSAYDPIANPKAAIARRNQVLDNMQKYGYLTAAQANQAKQQPLGVSYHSVPGDAWENNPLFTNFLFDYAGKQGISADMILQGGLKIYTTINPQVQTAINNVFWGSAYQNDFPSYNEPGVLQGAALFLDPSTGGILGGAGSREQGFVPGGTDRIYSLSSPGSSIKPIMEYAPAIESGNFTPNSILNNTPHDFGGGYIPQNYDRGSAPATTTLAYALETSQNVASISLLQQVGLATGTAFAENDGIPLTAADKEQLGIGIGGNLAVSPYIMAQAYEAFDNQGVQMQEHLITQIVNASGETIFSYHSAAKRIMASSTAATMTQLMQNVVNAGTGVTAQVPGWQVAGKTGTVQYSSSGSDVNADWLSRVWFDGYTANMVGSLYLGYDYTDETHHLYDFPDPVGNAGKLFADIVAQAEQGVTPIPLQTTVAPSAGAPQNVTPTGVTQLQATYDGMFQDVKLTWQGVVSSSNTIQYKISRVATTSASPSGGNPAQTPPAGSGPGSSSQSGTTLPGQTQVLGTTSGNSYTDTAVNPGASYEYSVQALDAGTNQAIGPAGMVNITIPAAAQQPPGNTMGNTVGNNSTVGTQPGGNTGIGGNQAGQGNSTNVPGNGFGPGVGQGAGPGGPTPGNPPGPANGGQPGNSTTVNPSNTTSTTSPNTPDNGVGTNSLNLGGSVPDNTSADGSSSANSATSVQVQN